MRAKRRNTVQERLDAASQTVRRWQTSMDKASKALAEAQARGDDAKSASIEGRKTRAENRLSCALTRLENLKDSYARDVKRERSTVRSRKSALALADRVIANAPGTKARWDAERVATARKARDRRRAGLPAHESEGGFSAGKKTVPDPFEPGRTLEVACNTRESPVEHLAARGKIDGDQKAAAERFRALYERSIVGGLNGIDTTKERVDGGKVGESLNEAVMLAAKDLADIYHAVGGVSERLLVSIVGEGVAVSEIAKGYAKLSGKRAMGFVTGRLIEAIDDLVAYWGMRAQPRAVGRDKTEIRAAEGRDLSITGPQNEWSVGRHGDLQKNHRLVRVGT